MYQEADVKAGRGVTTISNHVVICIVEVGTVRLVEECVAALWRDCASSAIYFPSVSIFKVAVVAIN